MRMKEIGNMVVEASTADMRCHSTIVRVEESIVKQEGQSQCQSMEVRD